MLIGSVVNDQLGDDAQMTLVCFLKEKLKILERSVDRIDRVVIRYVISVIFERRRIKREQPDRGYPKLLQIIQLLGQAAKVADTIAVAVMESADVSFVDDGVLIPEWVIAQIAEPGIPSGCFRCRLRQSGLSHFV